MSESVKKSQSGSTQASKLTPAEPSSQSLSSRSLNSGSLSSGTILHLQKAIGNQRVQRLIAQRKRPTRRNIQRQANPGAPIEEEQRETSSSVVPLTAQSLGITHPVAESLKHPDVRFRVPEFENIKAAYLDKDLKIPEAVIKDRLTQLLGRMKAEKKLTSSDPIPDIVAKIFPSPGKIDEKAFEAAVDTSDKESIYENIFDAHTAVKSAEKPKLKTAITDAIALIAKAEANAAGLTAVFGTKSATAKSNYAKARTVLTNASKDMATFISTDYNLDDPQVGLGGWARFDTQHMHLTLDVAKVVDENETKATLVHEACHLADSSVDDLGYYASDGFEAMSEDEKVGNAAHYEELIWRELGTSKFPKATFTPGVMSGGKPPTREDDIKREASEYLRMAWDAAVDTHTFIRNLRVKYLKKDKTPFTTHKALILEISKLIDLTVHEQDPAHAIVTTIDVTLSESIARGVAIVGSKLKKVPFPALGAKTDTQLQNELVAGAAALYGNLLKDAGRDKKLLDWFFAHYKSLPEV